MDFPICDVRCEITTLLKPGVAASYQVVLFGPLNTITLSHSLVTLCRISTRISCYRDHLACRCEQANVLMHAHSSPILKTRSISQVVLVGVSESLVWYCGVTQRYMSAFL